jgi:opacity protein-like surface antigen
LKYIQCIRFFFIIFAPQTFIKIIMKKIILVLTAVFTICLSDNQVNAQVLSEGNMNVDVYHGFPNLQTTFLKLTYANSGSELDVKFSSVGPLGGRFEYLLADKVGLGIDIGYISSSLIYSQVSGFDYKLYEYTIKLQKLGIMPFINYHFIENDNLDFYGMFGVGYGKRTLTFTTNDPNFLDDSLEGSLPIAARIGVGLRYFFTENLGANLGLGFGQGGLINAGVSVKF